MIEEYRRVSEGGSFHLIDFATLLKLSKASEEVVNEVKTTEVITALAEAHDLIDGQVIYSPTDQELDWYKFADVARTAVWRWFVEQYGSSAVIRDIQNPGVDLLVTVGQFIYCIDITPLGNLSNFGGLVADLSNLVQQRMREVGAANTDKVVAGLISVVCEDKSSAEVIRSSIPSLPFPKSIFIQLGYLQLGEFHPLA